MEYYCGIDTADKDSNAICVAHKEGELIVIDNLVICKESDFENKIKDLAKHYKFRELSNQLKPKVRFKTSFLEQFLENNKIFLNKSQGKNILEL